MVGFCPYTILAKAKEVMEMEQKKISAVPPSVPMFPAWNVDCNSHQRCRSVWRDVWVRTVWRELLHPTSPMRFDCQEIIDLVNKTEFPEMTQGCKEEMVGIIQDVGLQGSQIVDEAVEAIVSCFKGL